LAPEAVSAIVGRNPATVEVGSSPTIIHKVLYILGGGGLLPSAVVLGF